MKIRKAQKKDVVQCAELCRHKDFKSPYKEYPKKRYFQDTIKNKNGIFIVAEEDTKIMGLALGFKMTKNVAYLDLLIVRKEKRSRGIGKAIVEAFKKQVSKKGLEEYFLIAPAKSKKTLRFYRNLGLKEGKQFVLFTEKI